MAQNFYLRSPESSVSSLILMLSKANLIYSLSRLRRQTQNEDNLKNEDDLRIEDDLRNEDNLRNEDDLKYEDILKYEYDHKYEDDP